LCSGSGKWLENQPTLYGNTYELPPLNPSNFIIFIMRSIINRYTAEGIFNKWILSSKLPLAISDMRKVLYATPKIKGGGKNNEI